jgi:hypothetical protein
MAGKIVELGLELGIGLGSKYTDYVFRVRVRIKAMLAC